MVLRFERLIDEQQHNQEQRTCPLSQPTPSTANRVAGSSRLPIRDPTMFRLQSALIFKIAQQPELRSSKHVAPIAPRTLVWSLSTASMPVNTTPPLLTREKASPHVFAVSSPVRRRLRIVCCVVRSPSASLVGGLLSHQAATAVIAGEASRLAVSASPPSAAITALMISLAVAWIRSSDAISVSFLPS